MCMFFFFKQKTAYEMRISDWSSDVCSSDLLDDQLEQLLHEKAVSGHAAWNRLFDETMSGLRFPWGREKLTAEQVQHKLSAKDAAPPRQAAKALAQRFRANTPQVDRAPGKSRVCSYGELSVESST